MMSCLEQYLPSSTQPNLEQPAAQMTRDSSNRLKLPTTLPRLGRISDPLQAAGEDSDDSSGGSTGGSDDGKRQGSVRGLASAAIGGHAYQNNHVDYGFYDDDDFDSSSSSSDSSASVVPVAKKAKSATAFGSSLSTATAGAAAAAASSSGNNRLASIINPDTMAAAAAIMARDQSSRGRPVLLGSNTADGTINVQLPTGMVIAVEATAFPDYNRTTATTATATTTTKQPNNDRTSTTAVTATATTAKSTSTLTLAPKAAPVAATAAAASKVPATAKTAPTPTLAVPVPVPVPVQPVQQPQQPPQERATSKATVAEIERALPAAASCVFHIFDRRVNLDAHSGRTSDHTYSLLRAWAQDDPYRHGYYDEATVLVEQPSTFEATTMSTASTQVPIVQKSTTTKSRAIKSNDTKKLSENQPAVSLSPHPTIDELRTFMIQKARATKKQKVRHWKRDDAEIMRRLRERGIDV